MTAYDRKPIPARVREAVLKRAAHACEDCGEAWPLELHHLTYARAGSEEESIFGHETPEALAALCRECHFARHIDPHGDFWRDPEEMAAYWEMYEAALERA
jgi:5-methylcytosine-specific restriction endonuclease McrA